VINHLSHTRPCLGRGIQKVVGEGIIPLNILLVTLRYRRWTSVVFPETVEQGQQDRLLIPFQFRSSDGDLFTMRVFHMLVVRCSRRLNRSSDVLVVQMKRLRKGEVTLDSARCGPLGSAEREVPFEIDALGCCRVNSCGSTRQFR
jgi:hypothetical protein